MFRTLLRKEMREQRRTFRLWIMCGVMLVSGMMSPLIAKYTPLILGMVPDLPPAFAALIPEPTILDSFSQYVKNVSQFGLILSFVLTMGVMAQETERGTAAMLLTKPVRRNVVVLAKWTSGVISVVAGLALAAIGFTFYTLVLFGSFSAVDFLALNAMLGIFMIFYLSMALLVSTLVRSQTMAAFGAFGGLVVVLAVDAFPWIGDYMPGELISWGVSLFSVTPAAAWGALLVSLGLIILFVGAAIWRFQRQEF